MLAAIGYAPTEMRLQFGSVCTFKHNALFTSHNTLCRDDSPIAEKTILIDTNVPDVASVQDLQLYIGVQGIAADVTADFTIWFEPGPNEGPLKGITPWSGILVIVLLVLLIILVCGFAIFVYLKRSVRFVHRPCVVCKDSTDFFFVHQNKLENLSFRSGGKKAPKMTEYDDGSGTGMIPLDQVDSDAQMRDAQSMVHIPQQQRTANASKSAQRTQTNYNVQQTGQQTHQQPTHDYGAMQGVPQHGGTFSAQSYHHGGVGMDYEAQSPQLYDLSGGGQTTQPAFYAPDDQTSSQMYNMDDAEMKPLF